MEVILASGDLKIVTDKSRRYGVLFANKEIDWFNNYDSATKLAQDIFVAKATTDDPMIGSRKFCPAMFGNGQTVVVVARVKNGYIVQPSGTEHRMEVAAEALSDPLEYNEFLHIAAIPPQPGSPARTGFKWSLVGTPGMEKWTEVELAPGEVAPV